MMDNLVGFIFGGVFDLFVISVIFAVMVLIARYVYKRFIGSSYFESSRFFKPEEYLPEEELSTIKQVLYLIMIVILVMNILYLLFGWRDDSFNLLIFDKTSFCNC